MIPTNSQIIELTIDSLSYNGGRGVGRFEGVVVFVPGTAPQDRVRARVTSKKSKFWEAELVEILGSSPFRRPPPCPVAARCGGCSWQHVVYQEQLVQKQKILADSLRQLKKIADFELKPLIPAPQEFDYRNRIQLHIENGEVGFFAKRSRELVPVERCLLVEPELNLKIRDLRSRASSLTNQRLEIANRADHDPEAFSQVNGAQNERLKALVVDGATEKPDWIMDLYCGSGNLTFPLREKFPDTPIFAVELSAPAIRQGQMKSVSFPEIQWHPGDVGHVLRSLPSFSGRGLLVLDPPRTGCSREVVDEIIKRAPRRILYVSCNPTTFARDAERLISSGSYRTDWIQGLDMFPQTEHVELVAAFYVC